MVSLNLQEMSREEKMAAMEAIWADLSQGPDSLESPAWHAKALEDAEASVKEGTAQFRPLSEVKQRINRAVS
jgi:exonuclease VII small subunit